MVTTLPDGRRVCRRRYKGKVVMTTGQKVTTMKSNPGHMTKTTTKQTRVDQVAITTGKEATTTKSLPSHAAMKNTKTKT